MIGAELVASDAMLGRDLAVIVLVPLALHESFGDLTKAAQTLTRARTALGRVVEPVAAPPSAAVTAAAEPAACRVRRRSPGRACWCSTTWTPAGRAGGAARAGGQGLLSSTVQPGRAAALTGASGAGKTTLAATILGLIPPLAGRVQVPQRIGYLAQDAHVFATTRRRERAARQPRRDRRAGARRAGSRAGSTWIPDRVLGEDGSTLSVALA